MLSVPAARCFCKLFDTAGVLPRFEEGNYRDDITAIVAYLPCLPG